MDLYKHFINIYEAIFLYENWFKCFLRIQWINMCHLAIIASWPSLKDIDSKVTCIGVLHAEAFLLFAFRITFSASPLNKFLDLQMSFDQNN